MIPEAQHAISLGFEPARATPVGSQPLGFPMLCAVDFQDQLCRVVAEVGDIRADRRLLTELEALPFEIAQCAPELVLRIALLSPQAASSLAHQIGHSDPMRGDPRA